MIERYDYSRIPQLTQDVMLSYIELGTPPGDFLQAVFANDLREAVAHADGHNLEALPQISTWVLLNAPAACYGSRKKVREWRGLQGAGA